MKSLPLPLVLASTSSYRRALFERLGVPFTVEAPMIDEDAWHASSLAPADLARELAVAKAMDVASHHPSAVVIGGDQVAFMGNTILTKPGTIPKAIEQIAFLSGQTHTLATAVSVVAPGVATTHVDLTHLSMRPMTREEIERYVQRDLPLDCCGAYKIETLGISLFERIETHDFTAITGLPLLFVSESLRRLGFAIP